MTEQECLVVVWAMQKMRSYLEVYRCATATDQQAKNASTLSPRHQINLQSGECFSSCLITTYSTQCVDSKRWPTLYRDRYQRKVTEVPHSHPDRPRMFREWTRYVHAASPVVNFSPISRVKPMSTIGSGSKGPRMSFPQASWDPFHGLKSGMRTLSFSQDTMTKWVKCTPYDYSISRDIDYLVVFRNRQSKTVISDNGTKFTNRLLNHILASLGIRHIITPPYAPQVHTVESVNRVLKPIIAQYCQHDQRTWDDHMPSSFWLSTPVAINPLALYPGLFKLRPWTIPTGDLLTDPSDKTSPIVLQSFSTASSVYRNSES